MFFDSNFIIFDTEFTSWPGAMERNWSGKNEHKELVQIGAVKVDTSLNEVDSFDALSKPVLNKTLSKYFTDLTGITQQEIELKGVSIQKSIQSFLVWTDSLPIISWGGDETILYENAHLAGFPLSKKAHFSDARTIFSKHNIQTDGYMSSTIIEAFDKKNPFPAHNATNDARAILLALKELSVRII